MDYELEREEDDLVVLGVFILALIGLSVPEVRAQMNYSERRSFAEVTAGLTEFELRQAFRMHRDLFFEQVALLREDI